MPAMMSTISSGNSEGLLLKAALFSTLSSVFLDKSSFSQFSIKVRHNSMYVPGHIACMTTCSNPAQQSFR